MAERSSVDIAGLERKLAALPGQARFAAALMLTTLARDDGRPAGQRRIDEAFDRPTPFTKRGVRYKQATKASLEAQVFVAPIQAGYLALEETGGPRRPEPGKPVVTPVQLRVNVYGNIPRGAIKRQKLKTDRFISGQDTPRTRHLPPGLYQRLKGRKNKGTTTRRGRPRTLTRPAKIRGPKLLVAFKPLASYRPIFRFKASVREIVLRNVDRRWAEAIRRALATAR